MFFIIITLGGEFEDNRGGLWGKRMDQIKWLLYEHVFIDGWFCIIHAVLLLSGRKTIRCSENRDGNETIGIREQSRAI